MQVTFDTEVTTFREILEVFFAIHDPTTRDKQGNDVGSQYRSVIFYESEEQHACAEKVMQELTARQGFWWTDCDRGSAGNAVLYGGRLSSGVLSRIIPQQPYCSYVVSPKVRKFREKFAEKRKVTA